MAAEGAAPVPARSRMRTIRQSARACHADKTRTSRAFRSGLRKNFAAIPRSSGSIPPRAFARAWFKLTHRDMGRWCAYLGRSSQRAAALAGPDPGRGSSADPMTRISRRLKAKILSSGLPYPVGSGRLASASTFRGSDKRRRANGHRIRLARKGLEVNQPRNWRRFCRARSDPNDVQRGWQEISLADLIVLGGSRRSRKPPRTGP